jgi:hypothetical protein
MVLGFPTVENPSDNAARKVSGRAMVFFSMFFLSRRRCMSAKLEIGLTAAVLSPPG